MVLAGLDKSGKSTLVAHGAAALTRGVSFHSEPCEVGNVWWVGLEEATGDAVRRFAGLGADGDRVQLVTRPNRELLSELDRTLTQWPAKLVFVDSLQEFARITMGEAPADGDNAGWSSVLRPLVALARKHDVAIVVLHHVRRSDGEFRGAGEVAAAADAMLTLSADKADPTVRHIKGRAREPRQRKASEMLPGELPVGGRHTSRPQIAPNSPRPFLAPNSPHLARLRPARVLRGSDIIRPSPKPMSLGRGEMSSIGGRS